MFNKKLKLEIEELSESNEKITKRLEALESVLDDYLKAKEQKEGVEPFIKIISTEFDLNNGIRLELDWNDAMINYLKRNGGYVGVDDDEIIEQYIADLFQEKSQNIRT